MGQRYAPLDANLLFAEDKVATASGVVKDGGGNDVIRDIGKGRMDFDLVVDVAALDIASNDELYRFVLQGSDSPTFASGIENLASLEFGATEVRPGGAKDSVIGRRQISGSTDVDGASYKYVRLNLLVQGTTPTITFSAWLTERS